MIGKKGKKSLTPLLILLFILSILYFKARLPYLVTPNDSELIVKEAAYSDFIEELEDGNIESIVLKGKKINAALKEKENKKIFLVVTRTSDPGLVDRLLEAEVEFSEINDNSSTLFSLFLTLLPLTFLFWMYRNMKKGAGVIGNRHIKQYQPETGKQVRFADVAGEDEAKESLMEIVDFLHNPQKYRDMGAKLPKGALLVGPPGTGKTLLAKAVAGEAEVPFFSISGSDFVEMFVGVGASRVRDLFKRANDSAPCIIFIDEIDAIGKRRDNHSSNDEREQTLNQLLSEMDGFDPGKGIIVLGATNRPEILDPALLRPGRFDRRITVENPDIKGREEILRVHAKEVPLDETVDLHEIALATAGVAGADLANMVNEAAILAASKGNKTVSQSDLLASVELVLVGKEKKERLLSEKEKKIVAYHEIGHAVVAAVQKNTEPVQKITIIPRTMGALGYVMQVPEQEKYLSTKEELQEKIITALGGRAAEEIFFGTITTGAANDIEQATNMARQMITRFGMSEKFGMAGFATMQNQYLGNQMQLTCADETAAAIDQEIIKELRQAYEKAKAILMQRQTQVQALAEFLIEHETITGKEFMKIFLETGI